METPEANAIPPLSAIDTPPKWALDFCQVDMEHLRQFHLRFVGVDATSHPRLTGNKLTAQALILAQIYPDEHACRAALWASAIESLTDEQRLHVQFPRLTESEPTDFPLPLNV